GYMHEVDSGLELEQLGGDVARRAGAGGSVGVNTRTLFRRRDQLLQRLRGRVQVRGDQLGSADDERHWGEVALAGGVELGQERIDRVRGERVQERVAVRRALRDSLGSDGPARAAAVLDDDRLAEEFR